MNLFDAIKNAGQKPAAVGGMTERLQKASETLQTGRAIPAARGPARATEGERIANVAAAEESALARQGTVQQLEDLKTKSTQLQEQSNVVEAQQRQQWDSLIEGNQERLADLLESIRQEKGKMDLQESASRLEQAGFELRLGNEKYLQALMETGRVNRLDDENQFRLELQKQIFADQQSLLGDELAFQEMMAMNDAEFTKLLANIDINAALQIASDSAKAQNTQLMWEGAGGLATAGANFLYNEQRKDK